MKTFATWLKKKNIQEGLSGFMPNLGQRAIPIQQGQQQSNQPVQLSTLANKVSDPSWHQLYDVFSNQYKKFPNDPKVGQLGQALYQSAQNGDMSALQPFVQQHLQAQRMR
jgi:hypothetical protein